MKINLLIILSCAILGLNGQVQEIHLASIMDGTLILENGNQTNIWGYAYFSPDPTLTIPAPLLIVQENDSVALTMTNISPDAHTIHLHGLDVSQANDGVPQTSFYVYFDETATYNFIASEPGTYLYHCHVITTLHLSMGMYGMLVVERPDNLLFENGPGYNQSYYFLASDLEIETNDNPEAIFLNELEPDYFMINGLSGNMLFQDNTNIILSEPGDSIALRLSNVGYSKTKFIFPQGSNPQVYMADGRSIPQAFIPDTLEIYPGERYSVIVNPEIGLSDYIEVAYYSMENGEFLSSNYIGINNQEYPTGLQELEESKFLIYPNPTNDIIYIKGVNQEVFKIYDMRGSLILTQKLNSTDPHIDIQMLNSGVYLIQNSKGHAEKFLKY